MRISITQREALRLFSKALGQDVTEFAIASTKPGKLFLVNVPPGLSITCVKALREMIPGIGLEGAKDAHDSVRDTGRAFPLTEFLTEDEAQERLKSLNDQKAVVFFKWFSEDEIAGNLLVQ